MKNNWEKKRKRACERKRERGMLVRIRRKKRKKNAKYSRQANVFPNKVFHFLKKKEFGGKILIHRIESENLNNPGVTLSPYIGMEPIELEADSRIDDGDLIHLGNLEFRVIHTPGHTKGGTCLYCEKEGFLISGDTLFRGTWGRTDLPTGGLEDIMNSITKKLLVLPLKTIVYPGHGKSTMIREERPIYLELKPRID